jgi:tetratricopeptide (TPR) repeat protein
MRFNAKPLLRGIVLVAVSISIIACGGKEERKAMHMEKGKAYYAQAEYDKAKVELRNVLQIDPKTPEAYYLIGVIEEGQQNWQRAFSSYRKTLELNPGHIEAKVKLGRLYLLSGALREAEDTMAEVLAERPHDPGGRFLKAAVLVRKGDVAGAIKEASDVVAADPTQEDATSLLAGLYAGQGDDAEAEQVLERGVKANPKNVPLRLDLAAVSARRNEVENAEKAYLGVLALEPKTLKYRATLANFYVRTNQLDKAEKTLRDAVRVDPDDAERHLLLVQFLANTKGADQAEKELRAAIQAEPRAYALRFALGGLYEAMGRPQGAELTYKEIIGTARTGPEALKAKVFLARIQRATGHVAVAEKLVAEVLAENPRDSEALLLRGQMSLAKSDVKQSIADLRAVLKDHPESIETITLLASAHVADNEPRLGKDVFSNAIARYPDNANLRTALAEFLISTGDYDGALRELDTALNADPRNVRAYQLKADAQAKRNDWRAAEETLNKLKTALPSEPFGYYRLGLLYLAQGKQDQAIAELELASRRAPQAMEPLAGIVTILLEQGKADKAIARISQAIQAVPNNLFAQTLLANVYARQQKYVEAEAGFRRAIQINPKAPGPYLGLANLYSARGHPDRAMDALQQGLLASPGEPSLSEVLAETYQRKGEKDKAIAEYEQILIKNPTADLAANNLASALIEVNADKADLERALALTRRFENASNPAFLDTLGWIYFLMGQNERALRLLQKAVASAPHVPGHQYHLGMALYKEGDIQSAKAHLQLAIDAKRDFPGIKEASDLLGKL